MRALLGTRPRGLGLKRTSTTKGEQHTWKEQFGAEGHEHYVHRLSPQGIFTSFGSPELSLWQTAFWLLSRQFVFYWRIKNNSLISWPIPVKYTYSYVHFRAFHRYLLYPSFQATFERLWSLMHRIGNLLFRSFAHSPFALLLKIAHFKVRQ